jgi:hypothetical protein
MNIDLEIIRPFGPQVLISKCPEKILNQIKNFTERVDNDDEERKLYSSFSGNVPNLLLRDFENIFLPYDFCREIGLKKLLETLANTYHDNYFNFNPRLKQNYKLGAISVADSKGNGGFNNSDKILYSDCWVNRYFSGQYTPIHTHGGALSGIIFLEIPQKELEQESLKNLESEGYDTKGHDEGRDNGKVLFLYGSNQEYCEGIWKPEQLEGKILIFPSWLYHLVYPMKTNKERRTLSFNITHEDEYYDIMEGYYENYQGD